MCLSTLDTVTAILQIFPTVHIASHRASRISYRSRLKHWHQVLPAVAKEEEFAHKIAKEFNGTLDDTVQAKGLTLLLLYLCFN